MNTTQGSGVYVRVFIAVGPSASAWRGEKRGQTFVVVASNKPNNTQEKRTNQTGVRRIDGVVSQGLLTLSTPLANRS